MAEYRIRKGESEYVAKQLETLHELLGRGLIGLADEVSVDGGPYVLVRDLEGVRQEAAQKGDLWRHWGGAREGGAETGLLSDFLDELAHPPQTPQREELRQTPVPPPLEPDAVLDLPDVAVDTLHPVGPEDCEPPVSPFPADGGSAPRQRLRLVEPEEGPAPVSFADWVDGKGVSSPDVLTDFGLVDDGIVLHGKRRHGTNWWRTAGICVVAVAIVLGWHTWVRTVADTHYPTEADLIKSQQGDGPAVPGAEPTTAEPTTAEAHPSDEPSARQAEQRLRSLVTGDILRFGSTSQLEDAVFQELTNRRTHPIKVEVEALKVVGSGDYQRDRPIEANFNILLAGVGNDADVTSVIQERLTLAWLIVAKYGNKGQVTLNTVTVAFGPPSVVSYVVEGRRVQDLGGRRASATDLLLESK